eukprot:21821-Eustigmatos_ZCMA.PRE.1
MSACTDGLCEELIGDAGVTARREEAAVTIQCLVRRRLALLKARRQVALYITKRWDPGSEAFYFTNALTGESTWERPL